MTGITRAFRWVLCIAKSCTASYCPAAFALIAPATAADNEVRVKAVSNAPGEVGRISKFQGAQGESVRWR